MLEGLTDAIEDAADWREGLIDAIEDADLFGRICNPDRSEYMDLQSVLSHYKC
jgi:hypothetical protein